MCSQFSRRFSAKAALAGVVTALLLILGVQTADAQLSVEDFPDLDLTDFSYVNQATRDAFRDEALQKSTEPFKIFDNLYYVGIQWVASYLLVTDDGLILIDSLHPPYIETGIEHIRTLGFDPADIKYVLGTHGHFDHVGGHAYYQQNTDARVALTAADWKRAQTDANQEGLQMEVANVDMVIQDGDTLELGGQKMTFYITPGHTEGVLSMEFQVRDGDTEYRAVVFGGGGVRGNDYWMRQTALGNIHRFQTLAAQSPPFRVRIAGHPSGPGGAGGASLFDLQRQLAERGPSDPHPFVNDSSVFIDYLAGAAANIEQAIMTTP